MSKNFISYCLLAHGARGREIGLCLVVVVAVAVCGGLADPSDFKDDTSSADTDSDVDTGSDTDADSDTDTDTDTDADTDSDSESNTDTRTETDTGDPACVRYVRSSGSDTGDALSWKTAVDSVQGGILQAMTAITGDPKILSCQVWVQAGDYAPSYGTGNEATFQLFDHVEIYGGFSLAHLTWGSRDPANNVTILNGGGTSDHVVTPAASNVIDGFTIKGGSAHTFETGRLDGGGMTVIGKALTVRNSTFDGNQCKANGGAVYIDGTSEVDFEDCVFRNNSAEAAGGAVFMAAGARVTMTRSALETNDAHHSGGDGNGGAISMGTGALDLVGCTFNGNSAFTSGGAIRSSGGTIMATQTVFEQNEADGNLSPKGSGLYLNGGTLTASRTAFIANDVDNDGGHGGAMYVTGNATIDMTNCVLMNNTARGGFPAPAGGGIYLGSGSVTLVHCTLYNNRVVSTGGPDVSGGGVFVKSGGLTVRSTIIWGNAPDGTTLTTASWATFSNLQDGEGDFIYNNLSENPVFVGGNPFDLNLQQGSGCRDAGDLMDAPKVDFEGTSRPVGGGYDIGAYEYN